MAGCAKLLGLGAENKGDFLVAITPPSNVVATVISATSIDLTWENTYYYDYIAIWRNVAGGGYTPYKIRIPGSDEYFKDSDLIPNTQYCYKLVGRILDPFQKSDFSAEACGTTRELVVAPSDVVATPISDIEIDITFKDKSADETGHRLQREISTDPGVWSLIVDLEPNREFFRDGALFLLEAGYTDCEDSDIGKQVKDDGGEIGLLIAFDNARRRWLIDSGDTIANASAMTITAGTGVGTAARTTTGLVKGSSYTYRVRAEPLPTAYVASAQVTTIEEPAQVTLAAILAADTEDKSIRIRWTDVANETGYRIEKDTVEIAVVGIGITDFLVTGLTPGVSYDFRVRAYNAAGNGTFSVTRAATTDAAYVPTEFEKWIRDPNIEPVYLAEIYTKMDLTGFTLESGVTWKKTIGASNRGIDILEVFQDSVSYVEKTSIVTVEATASTFWFDYDNRILYVHTSDGTDPANFLIEGAFWLYFSTHKDKEFNDNFYLPFLAKEDIPDITQEIKPYFEGNFSISSGSIAFMNAKIMGEHFFDKKFEAYTWINGKVILKAGRDDFTYAQFKEIFTAYIDKKGCTDAKITFQLRDMRKEMSQSIVLDKFNTTDYPDIEDRYIGKPIPIAFGTRKLEIPVPIDMENQKFKFNASAIASRSKAVEGATRNGAVLTEDVHYYIDLQRSIITFDRDGKFIIEAGINDEIDFTEGEPPGDALNATLDAGIYTTTTLRAEIKSKMEGAGALTYTVTCTGAPERRFTISASGVFALLWRTGTNGKDGTGTSVGLTIGFDDDDDMDGDESYEADADVITIVRGDIIGITFTGFVNSANEVITNGAEIFKYLMNNYKGIADSELNLDSIYASKYSKAEPPELTFLIGSEPSFDEIVRTIEHSIEAYTFQDEFGRLGIRPQQTVVASNAKHVISSHIFGHTQGKDRSSLFWKVNVFYNKDYEDNWDVRTDTDNTIYWRHKITAELPIYTYFKVPLHASNLATAVLLLLNKEKIENDLPMLLFDVMPGDLIKFSRTRFYDSTGTASEKELRVIRISKSPASGRTSITAEVV